MTTMNMRLRVLVLGLAALATTLVLAACGGSDDKMASAGNTTDRAFTAEMIPHHRSAVQMAEVAARRGRHAEIKTLAENIVKTQNTEIATMRDIDGRLAAAGVKRGSLGVDHAMMGMDTDTGRLKTVKVFDRAFVDMMVPHHQGAVRMARIELAKGQNAELKQLAQAIIDGQSKEIGQMNTWRASWFGQASPAGGVPAA